MPTINFPTPAANPIAAGVISLGKVYIGVVDENPRILGNRINVTITEEDGSTVVIAPAQQPFILNAGGLFSYNGSTVILSTDGPYALALDTAQDVQVYYLPNSGVGQDVNTSAVVMNARGSPPAAIANAGQWFTMNVGGVTEVFYIDNLGQIIQITENGGIKVDLGESVVEALRLIAEEEVEGTQFRGDLITLEIIDGDVNCDLTLGLNYYLYLDENVDVFGFSGAPEIRVPNITVRIENSGSFIINTFEPAQEGVTVFVPEAWGASTSLSPPFNQTTDYGVALFTGPEGVGKALGIYPVPMVLYAP